MNRRVLRISHDFKRNPKKMIWERKRRGKREGGEREIEGEIERGSVGQVLELLLDL